MTKYYDIYTQIPGITYQTTDFYAKKIDIDSIKKPTIID